MKLSDIYVMAKHCKSSQQFERIMDEERIRFSTAHKDTRMDNILKKIAARYDLTLTDVLQISQKMEIINVRRIFIYIMYTRYKYTEERIAYYLGLDRSTVSYHYKKACEFIEVDKIFRAEIEQFNKLRP